MTAPVATTARFFRAMRELRDRRRRTAAQLLAGIPLPAEDISWYRSLLQYFKNLPGRGTERILKDSQGTPVPFRLDAELTALERDLIFVEQGSEALLSRLQREIPSFEERVEEMLAVFPLSRIKRIISDRDGTVEPYCERYSTSVQSIHSAVWLTRLAHRLHGEALLLTSAPLQQGGLEEVTVMPRGSWMLAGSKGREWISRDGEYRRAPIPRHAEKLLQQLQFRINRLYENKRFSKLADAGSGLQQKHGQITVSRQTGRGAVPPPVSEAFKEAVVAIAAAEDPTGQMLTVTDTGLDLELTLTNESGTPFTKGDGLRLLQKELPLPPVKGTVAVWGDTASDLPMAEAVQQQSMETVLLLVSQDPELRNRARALPIRTLFVNDPAIPLAYACKTTEKDLP